MSLEKDLKELLSLYQEKYRTLRGLEIPEMAPLEHTVKTFIAQLMHIIAKEDDRKTHQDMELHR